MVLQEEKLSWEVFPLYMRRRFIKGCMSPTCIIPLLQKFQRCWTSHPGETRLHSIANQWPNPLHTPRQTDLSDADSGGIKKWTKTSAFTSKNSTTRSNIVALPSSFRIRSDISPLSGCKMLLLPTKYSLRYVLTLLDSRSRSTRPG